MESADDMFREFSLSSGISNSEPTPRLSSLDDCVIRQIGSPLFVVPFAGWGWYTDPSDDYSTKTAEAVAVPENLRIQVVELFEWNGRRRGGIAKIIDGNAQFDGMWALFYTYDAVGVFDFEAEIAQYWIHIGPNRPSLYPPEHNPSFGEFWPVVKFGDCKRHSGMAMIASSLNQAESKLGR